MNKLVENLVLTGNENNKLTGEREILFKELDYRDTIKFVEVLNHIDMLCIDLLTENIEDIIPKVDNIRNYILYLTKYDIFHDKLAIEIPNKNNDDNNDE